MPALTVKQIEKALSAKTITEPTLRKIVADIGIPPEFGPGKIFTQGIINPDIIGADFDIKQAEMGMFMQAVTAPSALPVVRRMKINPLGTPTEVDRYKVKLEVGRRER